jgi:hypothetical protein
MFFVIYILSNSPKFVAYVFEHSKSISEEKTHSPPKSSNAIRNPPIPANKSMNVNLGFLIILFFVNNILYCFNFF